MNMITKSMNRTWKDEEDLACGSENDESSEMEIDFVTVPKDWEDQAIRKPTEIGFGASMSVASDGCKSESSRSVDMHRRVRSKSVVE
jgi:hypothetical protein